MMQSRDPALFLARVEHESLGRRLSPVSAWHPGLLRVRGPGDLHRLRRHLSADIVEALAATVRGREGSGARPAARACASPCGIAGRPGHRRSDQQLRHDPRSHHRMSTLFRDAAWVEAFDGFWNVLDGEKFADIRDPRIGALHYTDMSCQPQLRHALPRLAAQGAEHWFEGRVRPHPRADIEALFDELLVEAIAAGFSAATVHARPIPSALIAKASTENYRGRA